MQEFLKDTVVSRYIQALLYSTYLPSYRTVHEGDVIVQGIKYIYRKYIIECISTGYLNPPRYKEDEYDDTHSTIIHHKGDLINPDIEVGKYKILTQYDFGEKALKYTNNFTPKTNYYDSDTHIRLGQYLRCYRDLCGVDLMPFYNCYCDKYLNSYTITSKGISKLKNSDNKYKYEIIQVPIKFNQTYTIAIDCLSSVMLAPAVLSNNDPVKVLDADLTSELSTPENIIQVPSMLFDSPITYKLENYNPLLQNYEKNLVLLIQVPYGLESSIVVLEGDYTNIHRHIIGIECIDSLNDTEMNNYFLSSLSLLRMNDKNRYAFSDRLIEFLSGHIVTQNDNTVNDILRVQDASNAKKYFQYIPDLWDNKLRKVIYDYYMDWNDNPLDITGYYDKDTEKFLAKSAKSNYRTPQIPTLIKLIPDITEVKMRYAQGDNLDLTGLVVTAQYTYGVTKDVTDLCTITPSNGSRLNNSGYQEITIRYTEGKKSVSASFTVNVIAAYVLMTSVGEFTLRTTLNQKTWDGDLYYSTDNAIWNTWDGTTITAVDSSLDSVIQYRLYLKGLNNTGMSVGQVDPNSFVITTTTQTQFVDCSGYIEFLLDYNKIIEENYPHNIGMGYQAFWGLFKDNTRLRTAPDSYCPVLSEGAFFSTYEGCTNLINCPKINAVQIDNSCFENCFSGCTSLTTINQLRVLQNIHAVPQRGLYRMFMGCIKLYAIPPLYFVDIRNYGCYEMFKGCSAMKVSENQSSKITIRLNTITPPVPNNPVTDMFEGTGGETTGTPELNKTYYVLPIPYDSWENIILTKGAPYEIGYMIELPITFNINGRQGRIRMRKTANNYQNSTSTWIAQDCLPSALPFDSYDIHISGQANATTYTIDSWDSLVTTPKVNGIIVYNKKYATITSVSGLTITVNQTLSTTSLSNVSATYTNNRYPNWKDCSLNKFLNTEFKNSLPDWLKNNLVPTGRFTSTYYGSTPSKNRGFYEDEYIWIPSYREIFYTQYPSNSYELNGPSYSFYTDNNTRRKNLGWGGPKTSYWLRSSYEGNGPYEAVCHSGGQLDFPQQIIKLSNTNTTIPTFGVAIGFCL